MEITRCSDKKKLLVFVLLYKVGFVSYRSAHNIEILSTFQEMSACIDAVLCVCVYSRMLTFTF